MAEKLLPLIAEPLFFYKDPDVSQSQSYFDSLVNGGLMGALKYHTQTAEPNGLLQGPYQNAGNRKTKTKEQIIEQNKQFKKQDNELAFGIKKSTQRYKRPDDELAFGIKKQPQQQEEEKKEQIQDIQGLAQSPNYDQWVLEQQRLAEEAKQNAEEEYQRQEAQQNQDDSDDDQSSDDNEDDPLLPQSQQEQAQQSTTQNIVNFLMGLDQKELNIIFNGMQAIQQHLTKTKGAVQVTDDGVLLDPKKWTEEDHNKVEEFLKSAKDLPAECRRFVWFDEEDKMKSTIICTTGQIYDEE